MLRFLTRTGPWLFFAAIVWYLVGVSQLDAMRSHDIAVTMSQHHDIQSFDIGALKSVSIRSNLDEVGIGSMKVVFDSTIRQASITNKNLGLSITATAVGDSFNFVFDGRGRNQYRGISNLEIHLPASINHIVFAGISEVEVSGNFAGPTAALNVETDDCVSRVLLDDVTLDRLVLSGSCKTPESRRCCARGYELGKNAKLNTLNVSMQDGSLRFASDFLPHKTLLDLGDQVEVTGGRLFLQSAEFGKLH